MKLAEALQLRADYQNKVDSLRKRICDNLKVQQGDAPSEDPEQLLREMLALNDQLVELIQKINLRNQQVKLPDGRSLADALVAREGIMKKRSALSAIVESAYGRDPRSTFPRLHAPQFSDIRIAITLSPQTLYHQIDELSRDFRALDSLIQCANWTTEL